MSSTVSLLIEGRIGQSNVDGAFHCSRTIEQAHDAFIKYFSDKAKSFEVTPGMSRALCGRAYLDQPYMLSQAEAAYLHAAKFPLDESPSLFKVL